MASQADEPDSELDRFRQQWREEVARNRALTSPPQRAHPPIRKKAIAKPAATQTQAAAAAAAAGPSRRAANDYSEEIEPKSYHDLPNKEDALRLGVAGQNHDRDPYKEPVTALEHYERAVEKEAQGQLGDSLMHYRQAFKLDDAVDQVYKKKHFPAKPKVATQTGAPTDAPKTEIIVPQTIQGLLKDFAGLRIEAPPPLTDASPPQVSWFAALPEEIIINILARVAVSDVASYARMSQVCKRLAFLTMTEDSIWRAVALESRYGFSSMLYRYSCQIEGQPLPPVHSDAEPIDDEYDEAKAHAETLHKAYQLSTAQVTQHLLQTTYGNSWRQMFRARPRIRFNGCYISTVNYTRAGATNTNTLTWGTPVHMVTYFRYLRFYRDGTVISLLTTSEPADVVHHLIKDNLHDHHGNALPSAVMKDALRGRWRLSGPNSGLLDAITGEPEVEGDLHVETEGVTSKYTYIMRLALSHAGKGARNNKLAWKSFRSRNRLTDDWADFTLKNDKAYYWSRVKSFGL